MKDIGNLFMGTGLGKQGYSIISQGELEQVLNGQPIDRRLILEEASGVIIHRKQRDEVKKRLLETGDDLLRLADILTELNRQQDDLHIKAVKAEKYMTLSEESYAIEKKLLHFEMSKLLKEYTGKTRELDIRKDELITIKRAEEENQFLVQESEGFLELTRRAISELKEKIYTLNMNKNNLEGDIRISEERIINNEDRMADSQHDAEKYRDMLANISKEVEARQNDYDTESLAYQSKKDETTNYANDLNSLKDIIEDLNKKFEAEKENIFTHVENEAQIKNIIFEKEEVLKRFREKREQLNLKKENLAQSINNNRISSTEHSNEIIILEKQIKEVRKELDELSIEQNNYTTRLKEIEKTRNQLENEIRIVNNRLANIRDNEEKLVGYSSAVKKVFSSLDKLPGVMGIVGEVIRVPDGLELAIETAAGRGLENIIVDKHTSAQNVIEYLKSVQGGRATLLPIDMLKVQKFPESILDKIKNEAGVLGIASRLVNFEPKYERAIEHLLGRVLIVKDMDTGIRLFRKNRLPFRIVTLEGDIINTSGAMTGGSRKTHNTYSPLQRKSEEKKLTKLMNQANKELQECQNKVEKLRTQLANLGNELSKLKDSINEKEFRLELLNGQRRWLQTELNNAVTEQEVVLLNIENLSRDIIELDREIISLQANFAKMQENSEIISNELEVLRNEIEIKRRDYEVGQERLSSYNDYLTAKEKELASIKDSVDQFKQVKNSYYKSMQDAIEVKTRLTEELKTEQERIVSYKGVINEQNLKLENISLDINNKEMVEKQQTNRIKELKLVLTPLRDKINHLEKFIHSNEVSIARLETEIATQKQKWQDVFQCELPVDNEIDYTTSQLKALRINLNKLQQEISDIGLVDPESIKEYEEISERTTFLTAQFDDLTKGKESLEKLLGETENIMAQEFMQFFTLANESFSQTFRDIFSGGEAFLSLDSGEDHLERGVNIEVKMPGKKTQQLSLLSGGERALTCIAFIFAILKLKPAPFCLLDEIDAALDETNLVRFSAFLKKMADDMQFIIITHRQTTIECGQNIFGVTMPQEGISTILTLDLSEAESIAG